MLTRLEGVCSASDGGGKANSISRLCRCVSSRATS